MRIFKNPLCVSIGKLTTLKYHISKSVYQIFNLLVFFKYLSIKKTDFVRNKVYSCFYEMFTSHLKYPFNPFIQNQEIMRHSPASWISCRMVYGGTWFTPGAKNFKCQEMVKSKSSNLPQSTSQMPSDIRNMLVPMSATTS